MITCVAMPGLRGVFCGDEAIGTLGGVPMCHVHYGRALDAALKLMRREAGADYSPRYWDPDAAEVVYYVRRTSDGLIKIGTTVAFRRRLPQLRAEHGTLQILLTHRGGREREYAMHSKFRSLRAEGEFFRPKRRLIAWIVSVRERQNPRTILPGTLPMADLIALVDGGLKP